MYEHNALGYWSGLTLCLTKVRSSRARCPATALIFFFFFFFFFVDMKIKCYMTNHVFQTPIVSPDGIAV